MTTLRQAGARLISFFRKRELDREFDEELAADIELATQDHLRQGMSLREARRRALIKLGGIEPTEELARTTEPGSAGCLRAPRRLEGRAGPVRASKEVHRESRGLPWLDGIVQDIRYAGRGLRRSPGFTVTAIATLAIGIGVNAAVSTVTKAVLFQGFRLVERNDRILYIHSQKDGEYSGVSYADFQDWRAQARSFDGIGAIADLRITLNDKSGFPERYTATQITANAFRLLSQKPILGRDFAPSDDIPGAAPVAILNYRFWERRYAKDPAIIGQTLQINGTPPATVIGVMPEGFSFPQSQDLWVPLVPTQDLQRRDARNLWFAFGRMADGVTRERARTELETVGRRLENAYPLTNQGQVPQLESFTEFFIGPNATLIYGALWGAAGFVFLIVCANVANLLVARAIGRSREISLRIALGAGQWRIMRQLLIESLVLSGVGGVFGWGIASWGVRAYELATNPQIGEWSRDLLDYTMDYHVLAYLVAISIGAGLFCGLAPALRLSRWNLNTVLKNGGHGATGSGRRKGLSSLLIIGEVALAIVLLAGAGVMIRSFLNMATADLGVRPENTLEMLLHLPEVKNSRREAQISFFDRLKTRLETIPGVQSAAIGLPPAGGIPRRPLYQLSGEGPFIARQSGLTVAAVTIGPDYFRTLGATVLSGREFNNSDGISGTPAVVVNQRFASEHWPGETALGQRLRLFDRETPGAWLTVVGVVSNIVYAPSRQEIAPVVYLPYGQTPRGGDMWVLIRTPIPTGGIVTSLRREISALDSDIPIWLGPYSLADQLAAGGLFGNIRNHTVLFLIFAAIALLLASVGLYAVVAQSVRQRTQEIGIRMAMGATVRDIVKLVFQQGMLPVGIGLTIGLVASLAVSRILKAELIGVSPADPITYIVASVMLILAATLGCLIPARRAMRVDPVVALRHE
jgi:putative ABC transport system permease protein